MLKIPFAIYIDILHFPETEYPPDSHRECGPAHVCSNGIPCRQSDADVLSRPASLKRLHEFFVARHGLP